MSQQHPNHTLPTPEGFLCIGAIVQPHGIHGEVRVHLFNPNSDSLYHVSRIWLRRPQHTKLEVARLTDARHHSKGILLSIEGCTTRNQAEAYRRTEVFVSKAELPTLEDGEFYFYQLVGFDVISTTQEPIGTVLRVMPGAAQDLLIVEHDGREIMLPIIDAIIPTIDLAQQRIEVELIPGLLDDHQSNKNKDKNKKK